MKEGKEKLVIKRKQRDMERRRVIALDGGEGGGTSKAINAWWIHPLGPPGCSQPALPPQLQAVCVYTTVLVFHPLPINQCSASSKS